MFELVTGLGLSDQFILTIKSLSELSGRTQRDMAVVDRKFGVGLGVTGQTAFVLEWLSTAYVTVFIRQKA
jgi:hypothetical protein